MIYPKSPFCPLNGDEAKKKNCTPDNYPQENPNIKPPENSMTQKELMDAINELEFATTDLNLFLDTHPDNEEALKTFTTLSATLKSYKHDYAMKYGPIYATDSSGEIPFDWVSSKYKWPWEV